MSTQGDKLTAIADAIRAKEGSSDPIAANDFPARIAAIETGTQLPTLTNPGTAADMAQGKQLIDQNGEIVTGTVTVLTNQNAVWLANGTSPWLNGTNITTRAQFSENTNQLLRGNLWSYIDTPSTEFGNATAADVAAGKTFTSEAGVKVTGAGVVAQTFMAQITGPNMYTFEMVGPAGLVQRYNQAILEQTPVIVPGSVIFISILGNNGQHYRPTSYSGFTSPYWIDNVKDTAGYSMSYGAFIAQHGQTNFQIAFTQR